MKSSKLVFFGSGPVGLASLQSLAAQFEIELVVTKPDPELKRSGPAPVAEWARQQNLPLIQPADKHELATQIRDNFVKSRLGVVVDYGLIIPESVIKFFPLGIVNSHFSLLPEWRGADPITFAILTGQKETGVSLMLIDATLDTGKLLAQAPYTLGEEETTPTLTEALVELSNKQLAAILPLYIDGQIVPYDQDPAIEPSYTRKLTKADGVVDWYKSASDLEREVRAYLGWPKSRAIVADNDVVITKARAIDTNGPAGTAFLFETGEPGVYCGDGALLIDRLVPVGKREISGTDFVRGYLRSLL